MWYGLGVNKLFTGSVWRAIAVVEVNSKFLLWCCCFLWLQGLVLFWSRFLGCKQMVAVVPVRATAAPRLGWWSAPEKKVTLQHKQPQVREQIEMIWWKDQSNVFLINWSSFSYLVESRKPIQFFGTGHCVFGDKDFIVSVHQWCIILRCCCVNQWNSSVGMNLTKSLSNRSFWNGGELKSVSWVTLLECFLQSDRVVHGYGAGAHWETFSSPCMKSGLSSLDSLSVSWGIKGSPVHFSKHQTHYFMVF